MTAFIDMGFAADLLSGKRILITGAGRGIGRACALTCSRLGASVIAVARSGDDLASLRDKSRGAIETWVNDVMAAAFLEQVRSLDRLDGLLNNAGTNRVGKMIDRSDEDINAVIALNIASVYRVAQAAISVMIHSGGGSIVNMSSQMGHVGSPGRTLYCMSKHAVEGLTKAMAVELAEDGIRVNSVAPTFVKTPLTQPMLAEPGFSEFVMGMIPMKKLATQEEVAHACVYLLSHLSAGTTGTSLRVDGGWTAQ